MPITIEEWLKKASSKISRSDAEILLLNHYNNQLDRSYLAIHPNEVIPEPINDLEQNLEKRANKTPLAYILGKKEFYGRDFIVSNDVLIPRPETETIIDIVKKLPQKPETILDVGTGSGCITITLNLELPESKVTGLDLSKAALEIAKENANNLRANVLFQESNLLENYNGEKPDVIVANLPYVDKTWDWLDLESLNYEPALALYAENKGLKLIYELLNQIRSKYNHLTVILESDTSQQDTIISYAKNLGYEEQGKEGYTTTLTLNI